MKWCYCDASIPLWLFAVYIKVKMRHSDKFNQIQQSNRISVVHLTIVHKNHGDAAYLIKDRIHFRLNGFIQNSVFNRIFN